MAAVATQALSASTTKIAAILTCPKAGTIDRIRVNWSAVAGTSPTYRFRLETVVSTNPSGSLVAAGADASAQAVTGWQTYTLTTPLTVARGDVLAVVVDYGSGTIDASNNGTARFRANHGVNTGIPRAKLNTGSWASASVLPMFTALYDDGEYLPGGLYAVASSTIDFNSSTNPDERGILWTPDEGGKLCGVRMGIRPASAAADFTIHLRDSGTGSDLATIAVDADEIGDIANTYLCDFWFGSDVSITAGTAYELTAEATTANNIRLAAWDYPDADAVAASHGPVELVTRNNGGSKTTNATTNIPLVTPIYSETSSGAGSSPMARSLLNPGIN